MFTARTRAQDVVRKILCERLSVIEGANFVAVRRYRLLEPVGKLYNTRSIPAIIHFALRS